MFVYSQSNLGRSFDMQDYSNYLVSHWFNDWLDNESRDGRFTELDDGEFMLTDDYDSLVEEIEEEEEEQKDKE